MKKQHIKQWLAAAVIFALAVTGAACGVNQRNQGTSSSVSEEAPEPSPSLQSNPKENKESAVLSDFPGSDSYDAIYKELKEIAEANGIEENQISFFGSKKSVNDTAAAESADATLNAGAQYSTTNVQDIGVDEADVLKTDGKYIYILKTSGTLQIVTAEGKDSKIIGSITASSPEETPQEMYLDSDTLSLISSGSDTNMKLSKKDTYQTETNYFTTVYTYDISDRSAPKLTGKTKQEGIYSSSRKNGSVLYLFTQYDPDITTAAKPEAYIPSVNNELLEETDICVPKCKTSPGYLVISSVDIKHPSDTLDRKAIISAADNYYVSTDNIYIYNTNYNDTAATTQLMRFSYKDGKIISADASNLKGYINDNFSLNEYNGNLRIVLTEDRKNSQINSLYVLDDKLKVCGSITDVAEGETIRSARFMGDTGYFVTFKNMDPLFSVDLKDPKNPKILGELKVTGFSSYLHFYGENQLLGVGEEIDAKTGEYYGIKLSMFDISDPSDVTETNKYVLKDMYNCSLFDNYKAVMIDSEKNVLGFTCDEKYLVFTYDKKDGFKNVFAQSLTNRTNGYYEAAYDSFQDGYARGCYVDDTFYLIWNGKVCIYDMSKGYSSIGEIEL